MGQVEMHREYQDDMKQTCLKLGKLTVCTLLVLRVTVGPFCNRAHGCGLSSNTRRAARVTLPPIKRPKVLRPHGWFKH